MLGTPQREDFMEEEFSAQISEVRVFSSMAGGIPGEQAGNLGMEWEAWVKSC